MIRLTLPVPPSANRWHRVVNGRPILSREAREYTDKVRWVVLAERWGKIDAPTDIAVNIVWYRERRSGDVDKRGGILLDALQTVCFDNDAQIRYYSVERRDDDKANARMEITIYPVEAPNDHP